MINKKGKKHLKSIEKHDTAAWANIEKTKAVSDVPIPDEVEVKNAKEWVDTNEK